MVKQSRLFSVLMKKIARYIVALPVFGLFFAVVWSILFDFQRSTSTHCNVRNYLPSISAAISGSPQSLIWKTCIALHATPRYLLAFCYWKWYSYHAYNETKWAFCIKPLRISAVIANLFELSALLGLTLVSSVENFRLELRQNVPTYNFLANDQNKFLINRDGLPFAIHETCFFLFVAGSLVCMISMCLLNTGVVFETDSEKKSARRKKISLLVNIASLLACAYFYYRHNTFCEPGVYTFFALAEYMVISSNMSFHYTAALDYDGYSLCVLDADERKI